MKRKILAMFLAVSMSLSSVSFSAFAESTDISEAVEINEEAVEVDETLTEELTENEDEDSSVEDSENEEETEAFSEQTGAEVSEEEDTDISAASYVTDFVAGGANATSGAKVNSDGSVSFGRIKSNNGKWSEGEDSFAYYGVKEGISIDKNFTLSATMNIDKLCYNGDTNPKQSSAGIGVFGAFTKTPSSVAAFIGMKSNEEGRIVANARVGSAKRPNANETELSDTFPVGTNVGTFDLKIEKLGNVYSVKCGENSVEIEHTADSFGDQGELTKLFPAVFVARDCEVTFSNIQLYIDDRVMTSVEIAKPATDNTAVYGHTPELPGLELKFNYNDGSSEIKTSGYALEGYDPNKVGVQDVRIVVGDFGTDYQVEVVPKQCVAMEIISEPIKLDYYEGQKFKTLNFSVKATYHNGDVEELEREDYDFFVDGKRIGDDQFITADMAGEKKEVVVKNKVTEAVSGEASDTFTVSISPLKLTGLFIKTNPSKTLYYLGEEVNTNGLTVWASYESADGSKRASSLLEEDEYTIQLDTVDMNVSGNKEVAVYSNFNKDMKASFNVRAINKTFARVNIKSYPRTTYPVLVGVSDEDYNPQEWYDKYNGTGTEEDGTKQYNMGNLEVEYIYIDNGSDVVDESQYKINLENFDIRKTKLEEGEKNEILIEFPEGSLAYGTAPISIPITVKDYEPNYWRGVIMGASTSRGTSDYSKDKMGVIFYDKDGKATPFDTKNSKVYDTDIEDEGASLRIWAREGSGKIADSNDGMVYYYTRLNSKDDFKISADVLVHSYINGDTDENRDGQEGFGIMARDIAQFKPKNSGNYAYKPEDAVWDENNQEPLPYSNSSPYNYSNMVLVGGHSGSGWPSDPNASNYLFNTTKNRINLIYRTFVDTEPYSASSDVYRSAVKKTLSKDFPSPEHKFHLSLEKVNGGYKAVCYDYQDGQYRTDYIYYDQEIGEKGLDVLDPENLYVGFFASRYADITVSNVQLVKSAPETDMTAINESLTSAITPTLSLTSNVYSTKTDYSLILKASNKSGGYVTIKQDGKVVYNNYSVSNKGTAFPVKLKENERSSFTVAYKPLLLPEGSKNYQELTSYEESIYTWTVSHTSNFNEERELIYVAPNGSNTGDGSFENPMDFDSAIGLFKMGQKIILLPGTYKRTTNIEISAANSGTSIMRKGLIGYNKYQAKEEGYAVSDEQYEAYMDSYLRSTLMPEGGTEEDYQNALSAYIAKLDKINVDIEDVVFDLQSKTSGFVISASYWDIKNFHVINSATNAKAFHLGSDYCVVENIKSHENKDSGICLSRTSSSQLTINDWPKGNVFKSCEAWNNADASYNNADGFATKLTIGYGNKFIDCITHHNSDDGWDMFCKQSGGLIAPITIERCVAYKGGYQLVNAATGEEKLWSDRGGRNGFKMGGDTMPVNNVVIDCIAFDNNNCGITANSNPLMTVRGYVGYKNEGANISLSSASTLSEAIYDVKGIVSYKPGAKDGVQNYTSDFRKKDYNYLNGENPSGDKVDDTFFKSLESSLVNGFIPQDPKTGDYQLNGFLELTEATKAKLASVEGWEDPIEESTDEDDVTEEETEKATVSKFGSSSPSKTNTNNNTRNDIDDTEDTTSEDATSEDATSEDTTSEDATSEDATSEDATSEDATEATSSSVEEVVETVEVDAESIVNGVISVNPENADANVIEAKIGAVDGKVEIKVGNVTVYAPDGGAASGEFAVTVKNAEVLPVAVQKAVGKNAAYVELTDGGNAVSDNKYWIGIPFDGDTAESWKIIGVKVDDNGTTTIVKPAFYDVSRKLVMIPVSEAGVYGAVLSDVEFTDMENNWAKEYVETLASREIVNGVGNGKFAPNANVTRGDFTKILVGILDIEPISNHGFSDVASSDYYSTSIAAAKEKGLINGLSETEFAPKNTISRQDMMVIVAKTLEAMGAELSAADLSGYSDANQIAAYAKDSVAKLVGAGLISGDNGKLNPTASLTRAECVKVLYEIWKLY